MEIVLLSSTAVTTMRFGDSDIVTLAFVGIVLIQDTKITGRRKEVGSPPKGNTHVPARKLSVAHEEVSLDEISNRTEEKTSIGSVAALLPTRSSSSRS
jgi:hypothetical protein